MGLGICPTPNERVNMPKLELAPFQALDILTNLVNKFPGLILVDDDVNGADLVDALTQSINENDNELLEYLTNSIKCED